MTDFWYGMGSGDMREVAHMGLHVAQMKSQRGIKACFSAVMLNAARFMVSRQASECFGRQRLPQTD